MEKFVFFRDNGVTKKEDELKQPEPLRLPSFRNQRFEYDEHRNEKELTGNFLSHFRIPVKYNGSTTTQWVARGIIVSLLIYASIQIFFGK